MLKNPIVMINIFQRCTFNIIILPIIIHTALWIFSLADFFVSLVWYLSCDDVAVCCGWGGDFGRRFCQLPPPPSYPCHDSVEEWRRVFQIQDPWYLLQRFLKIFNLTLSLSYIYMYMYHKWHVDNTNNHHANIYMVYLSIILIVMLT